MHDMSEQQEAIRERIRRLSQATRKSYSALATGAGLASSTVTRFMNDPSVTHLLSTRTLAKLDALSQTPIDRGVPEDPALLAELGERMRLARSVFARNTPDQDVAKIMGWSVVQMEAIFAGTEAPSLGALRTFAHRLNITTDFLLSESLEGLPRASERALTAVRPTLGLPPGGTGPNTDTDPA
jgi:transcriptional regulator with XRE-family HTH domain